MEIGLNELDIIFNCSTPKPSSQPLTFILKYFLITIKKNKRAIDFSENPIRFRIVAAEDNELFEKGELIGNHTEEYLRQI